ncbi:MAG TPA: caspase family protein [Coleofasciculaceae cyanobacterium]|jgi:WD40 repeat protein
MSRDALVVGINTYKFMAGLQAPAQDAEAIAQQLHTYGEFRVHRLPEVIQSGKPQIGIKTAITLRELETSLVNLFKPKGSTIPHTALFYFSGHGIQREVGIQEGYLALSDSNPDKGIYGLSLFWLRRLLQESPVRQRIIILDCCHSGEFLHFLEADPGARPGTDRLFMAASREYETAYESLESPYSIFTQAILTGLDPSRVAAGAVTSHSLTDWVSHHLKDEIQQPLFESSGSEIILTRCEGGKPLAPKAQKTSSICPYRGLECFDEHHSEYFFGREDLTLELVTKLQSDRFVAVVGASGIGKSSLVRAGLVATLKQRAPLQWRIKFLTPGEHPLKSLACAFIDPNLGGLERAEQLRRAETFLQDGSRGLAQLVQASLPLETTSASGTVRPRLLLIIDQFEEVFTLSRGSRAEQERQQFFNCLMGALATDSALSVAIALRSDFQSKCALYEGLAQNIEQHGVVVNPLKYEQIKATILKPAQKIGLVCEPSLVYNMMLDVIGAPGELPLLQYTLLELWNHRRTGAEGAVARLTLEAYQELGGVRGTLQKRASHVFNQLTPEEQQVAKRIFLALTQLGEGTEDTRRRVMKSELVSAAFPIELVEQVLEKMVAAKLVVTSHDDGQRSPGIPDEYRAVAIANSKVLDCTSSGSTGLGSTGSGSTGLNPRLTGERVDVVHETLIRHWGLLRSWLDESRDMMRRMRRFEQAAQEWDSVGRPAGELLLHGLRLRDAEDFQRTHAHELSALAQAYIAASHAEIRRARRESRQLRVAVPTILLVTLAAVLSQYRGTVHSQVEREQQVQLATARERAAIAQTILQDSSSDPMTALLVSRLAAESGSANYETQSSLRAALKDLRLQLELQGHKGAVHQLAFSPDRRHLATAGADGTLRLWVIDAQTILNTPLQPAQLLSWAEPHQEKTAIEAIAFSPDGGQVAAIAHHSPRVKIWSVETGKVRLQLISLAPVKQVIFSPNGKWIATAQSDRSISLWQADTGKLQAHLPQTSDVSHLQFSPNGEMLLAVPSGIGSSSTELSVSTPSVSAISHTVQIWRLVATPAQAPAQILKLEALVPLLHSSPVTYASFSPSGQIATTTTDGKISLWTSTGQLRQAFLPLAQPDSPSSPQSGSALQPATHLQFSPDESLLAIANSQQTWLWNLRSGRMQTELVPPNGVLLQKSADLLLRFSPDGRFILTKGALTEGIEPLYLWNTQTGQEVGTLQSQGKLESAEFSPDGTYVATGAAGLVRLWSTEAGGELPTINLPHAVVEWSMFFPSAGSATQPFADTPPKAESGVNGLKPGAIATRFMTVTSEGKLQNWQILTDALPTPSPASPSVLPSYRAVIEPQNIWRNLSALMGERVIHESNLYMLSTTAHERPVATPLPQNTPPTSTQRMQAAVQTASLNPQRVLSESLLTPADGSRLSGVALSPDGQQMATATTEGQIEMWRIRADQSMKRRLRIRNWRSTSGQVAPLSRVLHEAIAAAPLAQMGTQPGSQTGSQSGGEPLSISQLSFSPDGHQILGIADDLTVRLWDVETGQLLKVFQGHEAKVQQASFSPDGQQIVTASWDHTLRIWQIASGQTVEILHQPDAVTSGRFSPDGRKVATASWDGTARIWDVQTGKQQFLLAGHQAEVLSVEFSPDGRSLITASADGTALIWDAHTGHKQAHLRPDAAGKSPIPLLQAAFSPDGQYIATRTREGKVHLWAGTWEMLLKLAHDRSLRQLTTEECTRYLRVESGICPTLPL